MAISIPQGFRVGNAEPIDSRVIAANHLTVADSFGVYEGLVVYNSTSETLHILNDATAPTVAGSWSEVGHDLTTVEEFGGIRPLNTTTATFETATTFTYSTACRDFRTNPTLHELITVGGTSISANPIAVTSIDTDNLVTLASAPAGVVIGTPIALVFQRTVGITQLELQSGVIELTGELSLLSDKLSAPNLPTIDPLVTGRWWNDGGILVQSGHTARPDGVGFTLSEDFVADTSVNGGTVNYSIHEEGGVRYLALEFQDDLNANNQSRNLISVVNFVTQATPPETFLTTGVRTAVNVPPLNSPLRLHLDGQVIVINIGAGDDDNFLVSQTIDGTSFNDPVNSLLIPYDTTDGLTSGTGHLYFSRAVDAVATISHHAEIVGEGLAGISIEDNTLTIDVPNDDTKVNVVNGIVYQTQPAGALNTTRVNVPSGGLVKSNVQTGNYQDRLYQNITNSTFVVFTDGYITGTDAQGVTTHATLEEGVTDGDFEIYVNAGRYDATNNPNGHLGPEDLSAAVLAPTIDDESYGTTQGLNFTSGGGVDINAIIPAITTINTNVDSTGNATYLVNSSNFLRVSMNAANREAFWDLTIGGEYIEDATGVNTDRFSVMEVTVFGITIPINTPIRFNENRVLIQTAAFASITIPANSTPLVVTTIGDISFDVEDAQDWVSTDPYAIDDVVNFRGGLFKRRTSPVAAGPVTVFDVPGFTAIFNSIDSGLSGPDGVVALFQFGQGNAPALVDGVEYRFTVGEGANQYVITADPADYDQNPPGFATGLTGTGLHQAAAINTWVLRLVNPGGDIAPGFDVVSVSGVVSPTDAVFVTAVSARPGQEPINGSQITSGVGAPNVPPNEDENWDDIATLIFGPDRWNLSTNEVIRFSTVPDGTTGVLPRTSALRIDFEGIVGSIIEAERDEIDGFDAATGSFRLTFQNPELIDFFPVGQYNVATGGRFQGRAITRIVPLITTGTDPDDAATQVRFKTVGLISDSADNVVSSDGNAVVPGTGNLALNNLLQIAPLVDIQTIGSIQEFNSYIVVDNDDAIPLGTASNPSAQVNYLTSFAPRENVEYEGNFYFYIGPATHADFLHEAALRPQEFTNANFVPGNNKLNWVTYNEYVNDLSEADRSYSERIAATRDVLLHAQVRREIEAAKQDVLLTLSDRDSEREDQLLNLRPTWRVANTRYDDGSRFRRNVLYSGAENGGTYTLTAGNGENARVYNSGGTTGTEVFDGVIQSTDIEVFGGNTVIIEAAFSQLLTQDQIQSATFNGVNILGLNGLTTYSIVTGFTSNELRLVFSSTFAFQQAEFLLRQEGRLIVASTTIASTVNRKGASLVWVNFTEGASSFTGEGLSISEGDVVGRAELISAIRTSLDPTDNNGVILGINHDDTSTHYFSTAKPWDDDYFTAVGDQAVHVTVSAGATGAIGATYDDTRISALGAAQRLGWSTRTYANNPEDYFDLDPSSNEYIIDNYSFSATSSGLAITGALLEPAVKSYSGFIWITSNASNLSNNTSHDVNRVVQTPFRNVNTIDLSEYQYFVNDQAHLEEITTASSTTQDIKLYGLSSESITAINDAVHTGSTPQPRSVDLRFMLSEPGVNDIEYQLSFIGATPYNTTTNVATVAFIRTSSTSNDNITGLERLAWELDTRAIATTTRPTVQADLSTRPGSFVGAHGVVTDTGSYFSDSIKQWSATSGVAREINNSLFNRGETVHPDTVVRGSDGTYYKWTFRGVANSNDDGIVIRYDNVQVVRGADGVIRGSSLGTGDGPLGSIYDPASA